MPSKRPLDLSVMKREAPAFEFLSHGQYCPLPKLLIRNWKTRLLGDPNHPISHRKNSKGLNNSSNEQRHKQKPSAWKKRGGKLSESSTMNDFDTERSKPWNIYTTSDPGPPQAGFDKEAPWKSFGTSMSAISFGFVATAILISMFLIMAIFEHLFKPSSQFSSPESLLDSLESGTTRKHGNRQTVSTSYASDFSVLMPGQQYPTFIAQPAPLPCSREGIHWPSHEHSFVSD